jgi:hypothetical protein
MPNHVTGNNIPVTILLQSVFFPEQRKTPPFLGFHGVWDRPKIESGFCYQGIVRVQLVVGNKYHLKTKA